MSSPNQGKIMPFSSLGKIYFSSSQQRPPATWQCLFRLLTICSARHWFATIRHWFVSSFFALSKPAYMLRMQHYMTAFPHSSAILMSIWCIRNSRIRLLAFTLRLGERNLKTWHNHDFLPYFLLFGRISLFSFFSDSSAKLSLSDWRSRFFACTIQY